VLRGLFVTGTDTGAGKTIVAAALMHRLRRERAVRYWKPVQTGAEQDDDTAVVSGLAACTETEVFAQGVRLPRPLSPHLAARLARVTLTVDDLVRPVARFSTPPFWIVEGAGGVLVPLNDRELMIDLIARLQLPVIVAARTTLGTINHTLMTLASLREREVAIAGVILSGPLNAETRLAIEAHGRVRVVGELPILAPLTPETLKHCAQQFDIDCA
jgi:dethiobiotin synthase